MGLDAVELAMEVEESFSITIPHSRIGEIRTVGDLYAFVLEATRDGRRNEDTCLTAATFYELRRQLLARIEDAPSIRPRSRVDETLPRRNRRRIWSRLENEMGLRFPRLQRPAWLKILAVCIAAGSAVFAYATTSTDVGSISALFLTVATFALLSTFLAVLTVPLARFPATSFTSFRGLVTQLVALNYAKLSNRHGSWNATDVWNVLQLIIVEQLGVRKEDVTPAANFVYDLGID